MQRQCCHRTFLWSRIRKWTETGAAHSKGHHFTQQPESPKAWESNEESGPAPRVPRSLPSGPGTRGFPPEARGPAAPAPAHLPCRRLWKVAASRLSSAPSRTETPPYLSGSPRSSPAPGWGPEAPEAPHCPANKLRPPGRVSAARHKPPHRRRSIAQLARPVPPPARLRAPRRKTFEELLSNAQR